jgi:hypothetical protein
VPFRLALLMAGLLLAPASASAELPGPPFGRMIARGYERAWVIPARGPVVRLAGAEAVDASPALGLLAVTARDRLAVDDMTGRTRWARRYGRLLGAPRWSSSRPVRLAFLAGRAIRIVDARGERERRLGRARDVAPAWRPGRDELAFVQPGGDVVLVTGTGNLLARWHASRAPAGLSWTGDGRHLVVNLRYAVVVLDHRLHPRTWLRTQSLLSAVGAPAGSLFGLLTVRTLSDGSLVTTLELRDAQRQGWHARLARANVLDGRIVWAPDGRSLMVERPLMKDWLLVDVRTHRTRGLELPRGLRTIFGGVVSWFR